VRGECRARGARWLTRESQHGDHRPGSPCRAPRINAANRGRRRPSPAGPRLRSTREWAVVQAGREIRDNRESWRAHHGGERPSPWPTRVAELTAPIENVETSCACRSCTRRQADRRSPGIDGEVIACHGVFAMIAPFNSRAWCRSGSSYAAATGNLRGQALQAGP